MPTVIICTHIEGTCQEEKRSYSKKVVLVLIASSYRRPLPMPFFLYFNVSVLHCTMHPSGLRSCPQNVYQASPFPLICGPENLRSRVGSICYISDRVVVSQPIVAPDADSKDADNSYLLEETVCQSGAWLLPANKRGRRPLQISIQMLYPA